MYTILTPNLVLKTGISVEGREQSRSGKSTKDARKCSEGAKGSTGGALREQNEKPYMDPFNCYPI